MLGGLLDGACVEMPMRTLAGLRMVLRSDGCEAPYLLVERKGRRLVVPYHLDDDGTWYVDGAEHPCESAVRIGWLRAPE